MEIAFAHQSFKWRNLAANNAGVTCIIAGIRKVSIAPKILFQGDVSRRVKHIGPYLIEMPDLIIQKASKPLHAFPKMERGNMPTDNGNLLLSPQEKKEMIENFPHAGPLLRRIYGSQEFIKGLERWCLWIEDSHVDLANSIEPIKLRLEKVAAFRSASKAASTREWAVYPNRFRQIQNYNKTAVIVPRVSSERREYLQVGIVSEE